MQTENLKLTHKELNSKSQIENKEGENTLHLSINEQIRNVQCGRVLLEYRDAIQGIPNVIIPRAEATAEFLRVAGEAYIWETTPMIYSKEGSILDKRGRELFLNMRDNTFMIPSMAIPANETAAYTALDIITNYHRGMHIKVFISAAEERLEAHGWTIDDVSEKARNAITIITSAVPNAVTSVIEQATQSSDESLFKMIDMSAESGASGVCLADSLSFLNGEQAFQFVLKVRDYINSKALAYSSSGNEQLSSQYARLRIEYHGHNDYGDASEAALGAMRAGAVVHVTPGFPSGIGERSGNASLQGTLMMANRFLQDHGQIPTMPVEQIDKLNSMFIQLTHADPEIYGPEGKNKDVTCAALHADYILKIWKKLQDAISNGNQEEIDKYEHLLENGYLPHREGEIKQFKAHLFRLNAYSNADVVALLVHQLSKERNNLDPNSPIIDPRIVSEKDIQYVLDVIQKRNRPLTPLEIEQFLQAPVGTPGNDGAYDWDYVSETHPEYQAKHKR